MTNQNLPAKQNPTVKSLLANINYKNRFEDVLKEKAGPFMASLSQVTNQSKQLQNAEPHSVIAAAFTAACLDLPIDKNLGFAHIVPYAGVAQFQMGWKGYVQLALRTGQYSAMNAIVVNKEAFTSFNPLTGSLDIDHEKLDEYSENVAGYAFYYKLVSGFEKIEYWPLGKVQKHAKKYSQAYKKGKKDSPWFTDFNIMAIKTIVKITLSRWGILSIEMRKAITLDQSAQRDIDSELIYPDNTDILDVEYGEVYESKDSEKKEDAEESESTRTPPPKKTSPAKRQKEGTPIKDPDLFLEIARNDDPENLNKALVISGLEAGDIDGITDIQKDNVIDTFKKLSDK